MCRRLKWLMLSICRCPRRIHSRLVDEIATHHGQQEPCNRLNPAACTERRKARANRLISLKKLRVEGWTKNPNAIDGRGSGEYAVALCQKGAGKASCPKICPARSPNFCISGRRATKKPYALSRRSSTKSCGASLTTICNPNAPITLCRARPWFTRPTSEACPASSVSRTSTSK
jgi:hypothetical protein